jgi:hypothetical protein
MAKVQFPVLSGIASGKVGGLVFDRRGFVRIHVIPANPQSGKQGNARQALIVAQKGVKACGPATREGLRAVSKVNYRWSSFLVKQIIGDKRRSYLAGLTAYAGLDPAGQAAWDAAADELRIPAVQFAYADEGAVSSGAVLFLLARALDWLGLYRTNGQPDQTNATVWGASVGQ